MQVFEYVHPPFTGNWPIPCNVQFNKRTVLCGPATMCSAGAVD